MSASDLDMRNVRKSIGYKNMTQSTPLKIWVISDRRAGHTAGSRGLVKAFGKIQATQVDWVHADLRISGSHRLLTTALRFFPNKWHAFWINVFYKIDKQPSDAPDIVCSAGRETQFLNILWTRKYAAKNFFVGTLRSVPHNLFTAFITPLSIEAPNHIKVDVPLTDIDRDALHTDIEGNVSVGSNTLWALLIGGKTPGYGFERQDWLNLAKSMQNLSEKHGGKWLLTTSRRTGTDIEGILKSALPSQYILDAVWYSDDKRKVVAPFLNAADAVFCTEDSMAMLGEAVSVGKPVYSLRPEKINLDWKETEIVSHLERGKKIYRLSLVALAENQADLPPLETFDLFETSPLDDLALKIRPYLLK